jgi:hypothetical protein
MLAYPLAMGSPNTCKLAAVAYESSSCMALPNDVIKKTSSAEALTEVNVGLPERPNCRDCILTCNMCDTVICSGSLRFTASNTKGAA